VIASIDEEEVRISKFVGEEEQNAFQGTWTFVHNVAVEKVQIVGRGTA